MYRLTGRRRIKREDFLLLIVAVMVVAAIVVYHTMRATTYSTIIVLCATAFGIIASTVYKKTAIVMAMVLAFDYFGLVPFVTIGSGTLHWYDFNVVLGAVLILTYYSKLRKAKYSLVIWLFGVFFIVACIQSYRLYSQPFFITLLTARKYFSIILFWPIFSLINGDGAIEKFKQTFIAVCKIAILLYFIQWVLENIGVPITFLETKARWGIRLYVNISIILLFYFVNLYSLLYEKRKKDGFINCFLCVVLFAVVAQARSVLFYMVIVSIVLVIISKKAKVIVKYTLIGIVVVAILLAIPATRNIIVSAAVESNSNTDGTIAFRVLERNYFTQQLKGHEWFGVGIPNTQSEDALLFSGMYSNWSTGKQGYYYLSDLGAFKIYYQFGIIAYLLYFVLLIRGLVTTYKKRKTNWYSFAAFAFCAFLFIDCNLLEFFTREPATFAIILSFLELSNRGILNSSEHGISGRQYNEKRI